MGYELNSDAYTLFTKIEVGIKEFLISLIREKGVDDWTKNFLGKAQLDSIKDIGKRINEASENQTIPSIEDIYISKIHRAIKTRKESFKGNILLHPFYYLSWSDMDGLIRKSNNSELITSNIGKLNRDILINNLGALNFLRNDVAHSRFITEEDYNYINAAFEQIVRVIPDFIQLYSLQYSEEPFGSLLQTLLLNIIEIESSTMLEIKNIEEFENHMDKCINSFWINSLFSKIILPVKDLFNLINKYKHFRQTPGGLLKIQKLKKDNSALFANIKKSINERKISD